MDENLATADLPAEGIGRRHLIQVLGDLSNGGRDEQLVTELRAGLERLAGLPPGGPVEPSALRGALDGAEFVVRGDILSGRRARLPQRLPSFVFLVLLPALGKPDALRAADRAARLIDRA